MIIAIEFLGSIGMILLLVIGIVMAIMLLCVMIRVFIVEIGEPTIRYIRSSRKIDE